MPSCHGFKGEGLLNADNKTYTNPPLWGKHSYNDGAGMYRLTNFAGFVKNNMPFGATYQSPQLTDMSKQLHATFAAYLGNDALALPIFWMEMAN